MARKQVIVGLSLGSSPSAGLEIRVKPYTIHAAGGDTIEWVPQAIFDLAPSEIRAMKITLKDGSNWPGKESEEVSFKGKSNKRPKSPLVPKRKRGKKAKRVRLSYNIRISFTGPRGKLQHATIDPDMVIET